MSDAVVVAIAKGVTAELAGATLSQSFVPVRSYGDWAKPLEDALPESGTLTVDVVPSKTGVEVALQNNNELRYLVPVDIAIRRRFGKDKHVDGRVAIEEIDALMLLVQEVHELFTPNQLNEPEAASWRSTKVVVAPHPVHLRDHRQFTGIVRVTYRMEHMPSP